MANIKIELVLDTENSADSQAFIKLMAAFGGSSSPASDQVAKMAETAVKATQTVIEKPEIVIYGTADDLQASPVYTEEELKAMANPDLKALATGYGIDWEATDGKHTNAKLARLVLEFYDIGRNVKDERTSPEDSNDAEDEVTEDDKATETKDNSSVSLDDLKLELGAKVDIGDNRELIVGKFKELGATKLTNLETKHYPELLSFLRSL